MIVFIKILMLFWILDLKFKIILKSGDVVKREMIKWLFDNRWCNIYFNFFKVFVVEDWDE